MRLAGRRNDIKRRILRRADRPHFLSCVSVSRQRNTAERGHGCVVGRSNTVSESGTSIVNLNEARFIHAEVMCLSESCLGGLSCPCYHTWSLKEMFGPLLIPTWSDSCRVSRSTSYSFLALQDQPLERRIENRQPLQALIAYHMNLWPVTECSYFFHTSSCWRRWRRLRCMYYHVTCREQSRSTNSMINHLSV